MPMIDLTFAFEGALSQDRKERLATEVHAAPCAAWRESSRGDQGRFMSGTLIHDIPEGNWAGDGKIIYYKQVKGLVAGDNP